MATTIQIKRGTTAQVAAITPVSGEPVWDTTLKVLSLGDGATAGGVKINPASRTAGIEFIIDDGGTVLTTGLKGYLEVPFDCVIERCTLLADQSGAIKIDIWKCTYAAFDASTHPVNADTITAANEPEIAASGVKDQDATLTGWTVIIGAGDILAFNIDSVATITRIAVSLKVRKT
jgi:hypothetical protein